MFPIVGFLIQQILGIVESQIEIERIFLRLEFLLILGDVVLQIENLEKLIFVNKNWPCDPKTGCKSLSDLLEFLERDMDIEEELEKCERGEGVEL